MKSLSGSNARLLNNGTLTAVPLVSIASVWPSAGAVSTARAAAMPPGPGWFSTTKRWPSFSPSLSATMRAVTSATPPAANGSTTRTGRFG